MTDERMTEEGGRMTDGWRGTVGGTSEWLYGFGGREDEGNVREGIDGWMGSRDGGRWQEEGWRDVAFRGNVVPQAAGLLIVTVVLRRR